MNFIPKAGLFSVSSLDGNHHFEELYLLGNPCSDWPGYRDYVIAVLPWLQRLDGHTVKPSDRIVANQVPHKLTVWDFARLLCVWPR